ncbi:MAG: carbon starvation protein A [Crenarchaeota archaeon]|nr:carbon starvation protein A [Thermoproteota archaeon]
MFQAGWLILLAIALYVIFYYTHGRYLQYKVVGASPRQQTPAHRMYDGVDYVPANKYVLYGHHFASIAGAGPIVGPAIALAWGWLPALLWIWFGNVFIGVVHDYLSLMVSVRHEGRSIGWVAGKYLGRSAFYAFNTYIWFSLLLVIAAFGFVISALFAKVPGAGVAAFLLIFLAVPVGLVMYRTKLGYAAGTILSIIFIILSIWVGFIIQTAGVFSLGFYEWLGILTVYIILAASLPVWVLLQPRDYMNAFILWASLVLGGVALIALLATGGGAMTFPAFTMFSANVVGGQPSPFWPAVPLIIACGALSGFHSLVSSGTTSKQLDNELHGLLIAYGGMETEGFLATMVVGTMAAFGLPAFISAVSAAVKSNGALAKLLSSIAASLHLPAGAPPSEVLKAMAANPAVFGKYYAILASKVKWVVIPGSYGYTLNAAFGIPVAVGTVFATIWITAFALTSLDTATRLARFTWQELVEPLRQRSPGLYRVVSNKWFASILAVALGMSLAATKQFLVIWPAFAGMNQLLSSLALMTIAVWVIRATRATRLGKALVVAPAVFMWATVTLALLWYEAAVVPVYLAKGGTHTVTGLAVGGITALGLALNLMLFALWLREVRVKRMVPAEARSG